MPCGQALTPDKSPGARAASTPPPTSHSLCCLGPGPLRHHLPLLTRKRLAQRRISWPCEPAVRSSYSEPLLKHPAPRHPELILGSPGHGSLRGPQKTSPSPSASSGRSTQATVHPSPQQVGDMHHALAPCTAAGSPQSFSQFLAHIGFSGEYLLPATSQPPSPLSTPSPTRQCDTLQNSTRIRFTLWQKTRDLTGSWARELVVSPCKRPSLGPD